MRLTREEFLRKYANSLKAIVEAAEDASKSFDVEINGEIIELAVYSIYLDGYNSGVKTMH